MLNDPEHSNTMDLALLRELIMAFKTSAANGDLCVIYEARGKNFTFGADLKEGHDNIVNPDRRSDGTEYLWSMQELTSVMMEHTGVIIVGYHGWIVGGGFEHTLCSDIRVAADNTKIMLPELGMGIFFSNACLKILPRIVGDGRAREMMLMGGVMTAQRALEIGLVNRVCAPEEMDGVLKEYAAGIALKEPLALKTFKRLFNRAQESSIDDVLYNEYRAMVYTGRSEGAEKRISAFIKKNEKT
jgi:enoyl-CoA hydratase